MTRHWPALLLVLAVLVGAVLLGRCWPDWVPDEPPVVATSTPVFVILDPTPRPVVSPSATATMVTERLPMVTIMVTNTVTPSATPTATPTSTPSPSETRAPVQKG